MASDLSAGPFHIQDVADSRESTQQQPLKGLGGLLQVAGRGS